MKIRIKFQKWGVMRFIGHLDIMRYFQKVMRRADIDIAYSAGFSPHQIMSFASPLGVGLTSDGEYMDIEVNSTLPSAEAIARLNAVMVDGMAVTGYRRLPDDAKNAMSIVAAADYEVRFAADAFALLDGFAADEKTGITCKTDKNPFALHPDFQALVQKCSELQEIIITKKSKKSETQLDLRPLIYALRADGDRLFMRIAAGSAVNIKPLQVLFVLADIETAEYGTDCLRQVLEQKSYAVLMKRLEVYANIGDSEAPQLVPLEELGENIV